MKYLWFVGDYASFDERLQENSRPWPGSCTTAGVDFGLLYEAERNAGNDVRRVGEEGLFEMLAEQNIEALRQAQFEEIFTTDPHSLNALRNEYPALGASYQVRHYTELLAQLLESGAIAVRPLGYRVTYHDPCYLARYNGVSMRPGASCGRWAANWSRCRATAWTASAAGPVAAGSGWTTASSPSARARTGSPRRSAWTWDQFVVACPKDMTMFSDAVKTARAEDRLAVRDITLLVQEAMPACRAGMVEEPTGCR